MAEVEQPPPRLDVSHLSLSHLTADKNPPQAVKAFLHSEGSRVAVVRSRPLSGTCNVGRRFR